MGLFEWSLIAAAIVFVGVCICVLIGAVIYRVANKGKAPKPAVAAPLPRSNDDMFAALSGGGPEATAIVKDAHLRYGLKRNLREHYEATKHLLEDPAPAPNDPPAKA